MTRFFATRGTVATAARTPSAPTPRAAQDTPTPAAVACASYQPGHLMHYLQQGQALRSPSERAETVLVDGQRLVVVLDSGTQVDWRHHDPDRLSAMLDRFPASRTAYPRFHSLRVGPYWFYCAPLGRYSPCVESA